jgi:hypothetical protein
MFVGEIPHNFGIQAMLRTYSARHHDHSDLAGWPLLMGKFTISMAIFNSYVKLPGVSPGHLAPAATVRLQGSRLCEGPQKDANDIPGPYDVMASSDL